MICLAIFMVLMSLTEHHMVNSCVCSPPRHPQERFCDAHYGEFIHFVYLFVCKLLFNFRFNVIKSLLHECYF